MDGRMDGQANGRTDGPTNERTDGRTDCRTDGRTDSNLTDSRLTYGHSHLTDGRTEEGTKGRTDALGLSVDNRVSQSAAPVEIKVPTRRLQRRDVRQIDLGHLGVTRRQDFAGVRRSPQESAGHKALRTRWAPIVNPR